MSGAKRREQPPAPKQPSKNVRLQKVLAEAGVAARKECERLIETGHVEVNGERIEKLPVFVDPDADDIRVDGRRIKPTKRHTYLVWNKPPRVLATPPIDELESRPTISDYVDHPTAVRLFPVGTLGFESNGLMLLTSNTKAAALLGHPRSHFERIYHARVKGTPNGTTRSKLRKGVHVLLEDRQPKEEATPKTITRGRPRAEKEKPRTRRVKLELRSLDALKRGRSGPEEDVADSSAGNSTIEILTNEPRDEFVSQAMHLVGHPVRKLTRVAIGPLKLREIGPGAWRELTREEMKDLRHLLDQLDASSQGRSKLTAAGSRPGPLRSGGMGASEGPGKRRPRVLTSGASKAPQNAAKPESEQDLDEEKGVDPEDFDE